MNVSIGNLMKDASRYLKTNSSSILTGCAVAGLVTTAALAIKGTFDASEKIEEAVEEKQEPLTKKEVAKTVWKSYIPMVATGVATAWCIIGAQKINAEKFYAMASVASMTHARFDEYKDAVIAKFGEAKEAEVQHEIARKQIEEHPVSSCEVINVGGDVLCFDAWSGRYFRSTMEKIRGAVNDVNADINRGTASSLNDFYYLINLGSNDGGDFYGWDKELDIWFSSQIAESGEPCLVINFRTEPKRIFDR